MKKPRGEFYYLFFALVFLAGCAGETLPTAAPSETSPDISYDIRVVVQAMDVQPDILFQKGISAAAEEDNRIHLTVYEANGDVQAELLSSFVSENPDGVVILPENTVRRTSTLETITLNQDLSWDFQGYANVDDAGIAKQAVKLASDNIEGEGFYLPIELAVYSNFDPVPLDKYDYCEEYGLVPAWDIWIDDPADRYAYYTLLQDAAWNFREEDFIIFTRTEELLVLLAEYAQAPEIKCDVFIIGYGADYYFTEKTYQAMQEYQNVFIGVVCPNYVEMGKMAMKGLIAHLDGASVEEVAPYFDIPFCTITNKTLEDPDVQVFLREMDVLPIRR